MSIIAVMFLYIHLTSISGLFHTSFSCASIHCSGSFYHYGDSFENETLNFQMFCTDINNIKLADEEDYKIIYSDFIIC